MKNLDKEEMLWKVNYKVLNCYLDFYRETGFWITTNQSWNLARWNIYGNVLISKKAISLFLEDKKLEKNSKAIDWNGKKGSRCFVAEHVVPFKVVKSIFFEMFKSSNPTYEQYQKFFLHFNRVCYVWHGEGQTLKDLGLNSEVPKINKIETEIFARYEKAKIDYVETRFASGNELFKILSNLRSKNTGFIEVLESISSGA